MTDSDTQSVLFPALLKKPVTFVFDEANGSSDGGAILLSQLDKAMGLTAQVAEQIAEWRDPSRVRHNIEDQLRQRVYGIACGYEDVNDASRLKTDPIQKMLLGRDPIYGDDLASQPTLCRFENVVTKKELYRMSCELMDRVIERQRKRRKKRPPVQLITLDLDPTADATYGDQQLSMFNGYYRTWCYLPMLVFATFDEELEPFLLAAVLRPGTARDRDGADTILRRVLPRLRRAFPDASIRLRLDAGFASGPFLQFLDEQKVEYLAALPKNPALVRRAETRMTRARRMSDRTGNSAAVFGATRYQARSWNGQRRVVIKAEVVQHEGRPPRDNQRFVVTNLRGDPEALYAEYCRRGRVENAIKELQNDLEIGRTSCSSIEANQFRVLLVAMAYALYQAMRQVLEGTDLARATVGRLRLVLIKVGSRFTSSVRRVVGHLAASHPFRDLWFHLARPVGAVPT